MFFDANPSISSPSPPPSESWPELEDIDINNENPRSLDEDNIDLLKTYGLGPYSNNIKKVEKEVNEKAKKLKSSLLLQIDGTSPIAKDIERQLLTYGRRIPFADRIAWIDALDASTIKRIAN